MSSVEVSEIQSFISGFKEMNQEIMNKAKRFIGSGEILDITGRFIESQNNEIVDLSLNPFYLIAESYRKENLHSDMIQLLLDPRATYAEGGLILRNFFEYLLKLKPGLDLNFEDYSEAEVIREQGRIDVLIRSVKSQKAIIIENKINNAFDMDRQLPRYLEYVEENVGECSAIIYLSPNSKEPDRNSWTQQEIEKISKLLIIIAPYDKLTTDLYSGWLKACMEKIKGIKLKALIENYMDIIKKTGEDAMNKPIMDEFYFLVTKNDNMTVINSIREMYDSLIKYRVERIVDIFRNDVLPFRNVGNYKDNVAYFTGCHWGEYHLGIDIQVNESGYVFNFWIRDTDEEFGKVHPLEPLLDKMGAKAGLTRDGLYFKKQFSFPKDEDLLITYIKNFKTKLVNAISEV